VRNVNAGLAAEDWAHKLALNKQGRRDTVVRDRLDQSMQIPSTMELVVTGIADNKLQYAGGRSALLTPSASLMAYSRRYDTAVVVGASLVSSDLPPVVLLNPTDQSMSLRKGGPVRVLQAVSRVEAFSVSDGDL